MVNVLKRERQMEVLRLMVEGASLRTISRITVMYGTEVQNMLVSFGKACERFIDTMFRNLSLDHVQMDKLCMFCGKKEGRLSGNEKRNPSLGDQYQFLALDTETILIY